MVRLPTSNMMRTFADLSRAVAYVNEACLDTAYASYALLIEVKRKPQGAN